MENARLRRDIIREDTMDRQTPPPPNEGTPKDATSRTPEPQPDERDDIEPKTEPPRTTKGPITAPKFGSAGSGGAELEPPTRTKP
jgi:hypothetical protein